MTNVTPQAHWNAVYRQRSAEDVSWYQPHLEVSLALLTIAGLSQHSRVIDVGGGASTLVDDLLMRNVSRVDVLDLSSAALDVAQRRLGARGGSVHWRVGDVTTVALDAGAYDMWHDRAVLHFLREPAAVSAYAAQAARALRSGGHAVIAGFGPEGPERCSGLPVERRSAGMIAAALGPDFELVDQRSEQHLTPSGGKQAFVYALLRRL